MRVQLHQLLLFSLILSSGKAINLDGAFDLEPSDFIRPFFWGPITKVADYFHLHCLQNFNLQLKSHTSLSDILNEIYNAPPNSFKVKLESSSDHHIINALVNIMVLVQHDMSGGIDRLRRLVESVVKDFLILELIYENKETSTITDSVIEAAVQNFFKHLKDMQISVNLIKDGILKTLFDVRNKYTSYYSSRISSLKKFRETGKSEIQQLLFQLTKNIKGNLQKIQPSEEDEVSTKLIDLLLFSMNNNNNNNKFKSLDDSFALARDYGILLLWKPLGTIESIADSFVGVVLDKLMKLFVMLNDTRAIQYGKELFIQAFVPRDYSNPSQEYQQFILKKYEREGLKSFQELKFDDAVRIYIVDLVHVSSLPTLKPLEQEHIVYIFNNFLNLAKGFNLLNMVTFKKSRSTLIYFGDQLDDYFQLFNGFYDLAIQAAALPQSVFLDANQIVQSSLFKLNEYCDQLISKGSGLKSFLLGGHYGQRTYSVNIESNYFFYKMILLLSHMSEFKNTGFKFAKFSSKNDVLVNKYCLEKTSRLLIDALIAKTGKAFSNYGDFSGLVISESDLESAHQVIQKQKLRGVNLV
jgi:hypothetical protein